MKHFFQKNILFLAFLLPLLCFGQGKKELEDKRKKLIREIEVTNKLLKKTAKAKEATYDRFIALQNQINQRENLIQTITDEISEADSNMVRTDLVIRSLTTDLSEMQEDYSRMMRSALRRKMTSNPLMYILSAESLNQAFRRWLFLRKYDKYRKMQAEAIQFTQKVLAKKLSSIEETKNRKENLLMTMQGQKSTLSEELVDKDQMLKTLSLDENKLASDLKKKELTYEELNKAIEKMIQDEIKRQVEAARKPKPNPPPKSNPSTANTNRNTPETTQEQTVAPSDELPDDAFSADFRKNKGKLNWPVESGFISRPFGKQAHPTLRNIEITNNGIDIRTDENADVKSIFDGKITGVQFIPGHDYTVIIQHGTYYSVYSNLAEAFVSKGQEVKINQKIGRVSTNNITGTSELHFELWRQKERQNPSNWIRK